jgi:hypothetical protein
LEQFGVSIARYARSTFGEAVSVLSRTAVNCSAWPESPSYCGSERKSCDYPGAHARAGDHQPIMVIRPFSAKQGRDTKSTADDT